jgi:oxalate decarboxylase/phosphoglucose isomerase-like protein (cupin superfamily)
MLREKEGLPAQKVIDRLVSIPSERVIHLLDADHNEKRAVDPHVGIIIVHLTDIPPVTQDGLDFHFHGARVLTGKGNFVKPHYHKIGVEPYHIISGDQGEMNLGSVSDGEVTWERPQLIQAGGIVVVQEGEVHSLRNNGEEPLNFTFACPDAHIQDHTDDHPHGDRYFTTDFIHGIPPWYDLAS